MFYTIKLYYLVAVLSLITRLFCQRLKNVDKIKNVKNVFYINEK